MSLREGDLAWGDFLARVEPLGTLRPHAADANEVTNILFSSGTTGEGCSWCVSAALALARQAADQAWQADQGSSRLNRHSRPVLLAVGSTGTRDSAVGGLQDVLQSSGVGRMDTLLSCIKQCKASITAGLGVMLDGW